MGKKKDRSIKIKVLRNWEHFDNLKLDWQKLLKQSDADNIFLTWEWIDCWRRTRNVAIKPFIIVVQNDQSIIAIAPFYLQTYQLAHMQRYQALRFLGDQSSGSEYSNFIVKKEQSVALKSMLWKHLLSTTAKPYWDFIWFTNIASWTRGGKTLLQSLASVAELNYYSRTVEFAQVELSHLCENILPNLSKSLRTNIRQTSRRLDKLGDWHIHVSKQSSELRNDLQQLFLLHNKHWQNLGLGTFERRPELVDFYLNFAPLALEKGWLRLFKLESEGKIQAVQLGYVYNKTFLAIQEGYNPDFLSGLGHVLRHFSYKKCQQEGLLCYDFLGVYSEHKRRWLSEKKRGESLFIWHDKAKNFPFSVKKIWPTGRYLKPVG